MVSCGYSNCKEYFAVKQKHRESCSGWLQVTNRTSEHHISNSHTTFINPSPNHSEAFIDASNDSASFEHLNERFENTPLTPPHKSRRRKILSDTDEPWSIASEEKHETSEPFSHFLQTSTNISIIQSATDQTTTTSAQNQIFDPRTSELESANNFHQSSVPSESTMMNNDMFVTSSNEHTVSSSSSSLLSSSPEVEQRATNTNNKKKYSRELYKSGYLNNFSVQRYLKRFFLQKSLSSSLHLTTTLFV